jgi:hypothetical protein
MLFSLMASALSLSASAQSQNTFYLHASDLLDQNAPTGTTANALKLATGEYHIWKTTPFSAEQSFPAGAWTAAVWINMTQGPTQYRLKLGTANLSGGFVEYAHSFTPIVTSGSPTRYEVRISVGVLNVPAGESLAIGFLRQWQNADYSPPAFIFFDSQATPSSIAGPAVPTDSFTIEANPTSATAVPQCTSAVYTITVGSISGLPVTFGVTGLPSGATAAFNPPSRQPPIGGTASSTLTVTPRADTPVGHYQLNVTASDSSSGTHWVIVTLDVIKDPGDFTISVSPNLLSINRGESKTVIAKVTKIGVCSLPPTALSVTGLPANVTGTFTPLVVQPPGGGTANSTMTISVRPDAINGTYHLLVIGGNSTCGPACTRDTPFTLIVLPTPSGAGVNVGVGFAFVGIGLGIAVAGIGVAFALSGQRGSEVIVYGGWYYCRKHRVPLWYIQGHLYCPVEERYLRS